MGLSRTNSDSFKQQVCVRAFPRRKVPWWLLILRTRREKETKVFWEENSWGPKKIQPAPREERRLRGSEGVDSEGGPGVQPEAGVRGVRETERAAGGGGQGG